MSLFKKIVSSALFVSALLLMPASALAYNVPDTIRVGLEYRYKEVESVTVSDNKFEIGYGDGDKFVSQTEISSSSGFKFSMPIGITGDLRESFNKYNDALDFAKDISKKYNVKAVPALVGKGEWNVYVAEANNSNISDTSAKEVSSSKLIMLYDGNEPVMAFDGINPQIRNVDGEEKTVTLKDRSYRGCIEFGRFKDNKITAVNVVPFDYYLYSVVPSEMPSTWEGEAIKAQAVSARSYSLTRMGVHSENGYDVCDGVNCQVYLGYSQEREHVNKLIDDTDGKIAYYDGKPINAVFFSSSGGSTDNSENVWAYEVPYLRAVKEINEEKRSWTREFSAKDIENCLAKKNINIGKVTNVEITKTGEYGRVQEVTITGTNGKHVLEKEECRTFASSSPDGSLLSRMYTINGSGSSGVKTEVKEKYVLIEDSKKRVYNTYSAVINGCQFVLPKDGTIFYEDRGDARVELVKEEVTTGGSSPSSSSDNFVFEGAGSGHGVGMSQYGAQGMAQKGYNYEEILKHYYTGITIE